MDFFKDEYGATYSANKVKLQNIPEGTKRYNVMEGCKMFDLDIFKGCDSLEEIILPRSFSSLNEKCFDNCPNLYKITSYSEDLNAWNKNRTNMELGKFFRNYPRIKELHVLPWMSDLYSILIGKTLTIYQINETDKRLELIEENGCVYNSTKDILLLDNNNQEIVTISSGVKRIYKKAFKHNFNIKEIILPVSIKEIDYDTFEHAEKLTKATIYAEQFTGIRFAPNLKEIYVPIGRGEFYSKMKSNWDKFDIREMLLYETITFTNSDNCVYSLDKRRLISGKKCTDKSPKILSGTYEIGNNAFENNNDIEEIIFPQSVSVIGKKAFFNCKNLKRVIENTSWGLKYKCGSCYNGCEKLNEFYVKESTAQQLKQAGFTNVYNLPFFYTDEIKVDTDNHLIYNKNKTMLVYIPSVVAERMTSFKVPDFVEEIDMHAFENCSKLETIILPMSIKTITGAPFCLCPNLQNIYSNGKVYKDEDGVLYSADHKKLISYPRKKNIVQYQISSDITKIGDYAFANHKEMRRVKLPEKLVEIGCWAFNGTNLETIIIPQSVKYIRHYAFQGCPIHKIVFLGNTIQSIEENALLPDYDGYTLETWIPSNSEYLFSKLGNTYCRIEKNDDELMIFQSAFNKYFQNIPMDNNKPNHPSNTPKESNIKSGCTFMLSIIIIISYFIWHLM